MEIGRFKVYMARVDFNPLDLGATESHSPAACSCIEPSGPRARSSPNVKVAARSVTERPGPVLLPGENLFSSIPSPSSLFSSLLATIRFWTILRCITGARLEMVDRDYDNSNRNNVYDRLECIRSFLSMEDGRFWIWENRKRLLKICVEIMAWTNRTFD